MPTERSGHRAPSKPAVPAIPAATAEVGEADLEESRAFNDLAASFVAALPTETWTTPEGLAQLRDGMLLPGQAPLDDTEVIAIPGPAGDIPARVRRPAAASSPTGIGVTDTPGAATPAGAARGVYLDIHGGGWCIGDASKTDQTNAGLAAELGVVTVSIDYRLAPEHPFPAGPDDCEAAAVWLCEHAEERFGTDRLLIGGGSAGGHLAALTLVRLRDNHDLASRFVGANLVFGAYDLGMTPSQRLGHDLIGIPTPVLEACYAHALPGLDGETRRNPAWSPLYADLAGLPPALFTVGTLDPLLDDSLFMAARWASAGNQAELAVYPESIHGFVAFPTALGLHARGRINAFLAACLER